MGTLRSRMTNDRAGYQQTICGGEIPPELTAASTSGRGSAADDRIGVMDSVDVQVSGALLDEELNELHAAAFEHGLATMPWTDRLKRHSLTWVTARCESRLCGFVNVIGDGGAHAILLDTCVAPELQGHGIGRAVVRAAAYEAQRLGCHWLHADYEPELVTFYERACGMRSTAAGLLQLR